MTLSKANTARATQLGDAAMKLLETRSHTTTLGTDDHLVTGWVINTDSLSILLLPIKRTGYLLDVWVAGRGNVLRVTCNDENQIGIDNYQRGDWEHEIIPTLH